jgi:hypothetical protein
MGRGRAVATVELLETAIAILETIQPCSVRAVCYQLVERESIETTLASWNRISGSAQEYAPNGQPDPDDEETPA